jgi:hypothetical protein
VTTVRLTSSTLWNNSHTSGTLRFLCLVAAMFALLYTHSLGAESAAHHGSGHVSSGTTAASPISADHDENILHADAPAWHQVSNLGEDPASEAAHCMAVQPAPGLDLPVLCESPLDAVTPLLTSSALAIASASTSVVDSRQSIVSAVLRI